MEQAQTEQLEQEDELTTLNWSILFLLLLIAGILLSFSATVEQRDGLVKLLCCQQENTVDVFPKRWLTGVLVAVSTGFFAWVACRSKQKALCQGDCAEQRSAQANLVAAVLVFAAALIRLNDLKLIGQDRQSAALEETPAPE